MNTLFIEYRDPLFGIIVFFVLIFVIALFSYWWGRFKTKDDHRHLDRFLRQFKTPPSQTEIKELIFSSKISIKSWLLLADSCTAAAADAPRKARPPQPKMTSIKKRSCFYSERPTLKPVSWREAKTSFWRYSRQVRGLLRRCTTFCLSMSA